MDLDLDDREAVTLAWEQMMSDCRKSAVLIIYLEEGEQLKGGLIEIGAVLAVGGQISSAGTMPLLDEGNRDFADALTHFDNMESALSAAMDLIAAKRRDNP